VLKRILRKIFQNKKTDNQYYIKYKISSSYEDYQLTGKIVIQSKKGGAYSHKTPHQIYQDAEIMTYLHPIDAGIIAGLCSGIDQAKQKNNAIIKYRLIKQAEENGEVIYLFETIETGELLNVPESVLYERADFLSYLDQKDCLPIGFEMGIKQYLKTQIWRKH
jgi:hypothetical protein